MYYFIYYLATIIPLVIFDGLWILVIAKKFYATELGFLFSKSINIVPVMLFYPIYAFVILTLAVLPAVSSKSWIEALWHGALLGLAAYGAYDLTNQATITGWSTRVTIVDMGWGIVVTAITSVIVFFIINYLK
jgi:uncharacterized membrane protein